MRLIRLALLVVALLGVSRVSAQNPTGADIEFQTLNNNALFTMSELTSTEEVAGGSHFDPLGDGERGEAPSREVYVNVRVKVEPDGKVSEAVVVKEETTTTDKDIQSMAVEAAKEAKFKPGLVETYGYILYHFEPK
jgi:TonB family protein